MRIQHNIPAMNAYRNFKANNGSLNKNLEKLSSGYKINRAGDDAAGLAISEKMRAQITGLDVAQKNAKDGISLVQTAEGALTEVHDMLNRMVTLAEQSANGTYADNLDREQLQKEVSQLRSEIDRIADSSNFNGIQLLDGSMEQNVGTLTSLKAVATNGVAGNNETAEAQRGIYKVDLNQLKFAGSTTGAVTVQIVISDGTNEVDISSYALDANASTGKYEGSDFRLSNLSQNAVTEAKIGGITYTVKLSSTDGTLTLKANTAPTSTSDIASAMTVKIKTTDTSNNFYVTNGQEQAMTVEQEAVVAGAKKYAQSTFSIGYGAGDVKVTDGLQLKLGDTIYTFAVGKDSKYTTAQNVIDLTDKKVKPTTAAEADSLINAAAQRLTAAAASNKTWIIGADTKTAGGQNATAKIYLTEREGGIDYNEHDLSQTGATKEKEWSGLVQIASGPDEVGGLTLQIGDTADSFNKLNVSIQDMHSKSLGLESVDISTQAGAAAALDKIKAAINQVSDVRGTLGATQNRLDHTINNLSVMSENITDAESTIRDTDVAEEMMTYTKNNILNQAAQAMLAQANQLPQGVLQLLQ